MRSLVIVIIALILTGCGGFELADPQQDVNIKEINDVTYLDIYDLKTIKQLYGDPDFFDQKHQAEIYASRYINYVTGEFFTKKKDYLEIWYLVIYPQAEGENAPPVHIYKERFSKRADIEMDGVVRENLDDIEKYCEQLR